MIAWVAGGAGFIGSHLVDSLLADGWQVVALDSLITGRESNFPKQNPKLTVALGDIVTGIPDGLPAPDVVYHLASPASPEAYLLYPSETIEANTVGTKHLMSAIPAQARLVFASSSEVYGDPATLPIRESHPVRLDPGSPRAPYAMAKAMGETIVRLRQNSVIARLFNVYGPRMQPDDGRVIPAFIHAALEGRRLLVHNGGAQGRAYCYVSDAVRMLRSLGEDIRVNPVTNIGNPLVETSVNELAELIVRLTGHRSTIEWVKGRVDDPRHRLPSIDLYERTHRETCFVRLLNGLVTTIAAAKEERKG